MYALLGSEFKNLPSFLTGAASGQCLNRMCCLCPRHTEAPASRRQAGERVFLIATLFHRDDKTQAFRRASTCAEMILESLKECSLLC